MKTNISKKMLLTISSIIITLCCLGIFSISTKADDYQYGESYELSGSIRLTANGVEITTKDGSRETFVYNSTISQNISDLEESGKSVFVSGGRTNSGYESAINALYSFDYDAINKKYYSRQTKDGWNYSTGKSTDITEYDKPWYYNSWRGGNPYDTQGILNHENTAFEFLQGDDWFEKLKSRYDNGTANETEHKAYSVLIESDVAKENGLHLELDIKRLTLDLSSNSCTPNEVIESLTYILSVAQHNSLVSDIADELNELIDLYNTVAHTETGCLSGYERDPRDPFTCVVSCPDGYEWDGTGCSCPEGYNETSGGCVGHNNPEDIPEFDGEYDIDGHPDYTPNVTITNIPTIPSLPTITDRPLPTDIETQCDDDDVAEAKYKALGETIYDEFLAVRESICSDSCNEECIIHMNEVIMNHNQKVNTAINELKGEDFASISEEYFKDTLEIKPQGEDIDTNGVLWKYYIYTHLELVSNVTDYSIYGLNGVVGSSSIVDEFGNTSAYGYAVDIDGKILKDSVAKSTQTAYATNTNPFAYVVDNNVINTKFILKMQGKGTSENYTTKGYVDILKSATDNTPAYQYLVTSSRQEKDAKSTINFNTTTDTYKYGNSDTLKAISQIVADKMYEANKNSFIFNYNELKANTDSEYIVVPYGSTGVFKQFTENNNGFPRTWRYSVDQVLVKKDGTTIPIDFVLSYNLYTLSDLIAHGFICTVNGTQAVPSDANNVNITPEDISDDGTISDNSGNMVDNDSDEVTPDDGIYREAYAVMDGTAEIDLENAYSEYIYSSNNYNYYIPEGVNEKATIVFLTEDGEEETLTIAEALTQKYFNADDMVKAMETIGVEVQKIAKTATTPDFEISIKEDKNADTELTEFYRDNKRVYKLEGSTLESRIIIITADGRKLRLRYVLEHNMYTIKQLKEKGLEIYETLVSEELEKEAVLNNETNYTVSVDKNKLTITLDDIPDIERVWSSPRNSRVFIKTYAPKIFDTNCADFEMSGNISDKFESKTNCISGSPILAREYELTFTNSNKETIIYEFEMYKKSSEKPEEIVRVEALLENGKYTYTVTKLIGDEIPNKETTKEETSVDDNLEDTSTIDEETTQSETNIN